MSQPEGVLEIDLLQLKQDTTASHFETEDIKPYVISFPEIEVAPIVLILSGGVDSTTLLWKLLIEGLQVHALTFDYGQRHRREIMHATLIVQRAKKLFGDRMHRHVVIDISSIKDAMKRSALSGATPIPEGLYSEESQKQTISPNRNMIFISIAAAYAISHGMKEVYYAAHASDYSVYPDCRPEFVKALDTALYIGNLWSPVELKAPFVHMTKAEIVKLGLKLNVPYELTWSCYKGGDRPCLRCGTCTERTEAFLLNDTKDPALTDEEWGLAVEYLNEFKRSLNRHK